jgi:hypothetical protein
LRFAATPPICIELTSDKLLIGIRLTRARARSTVVEETSIDSIAHPMAKPFPLNPKNPERICWGCDKYCPPDAMRCGNGSERTQHPIELFGEGWNDWGLAAADKEEAEKKP